VGKKIDLTQDPSLPFEHVKEQLVEADVAFGNLESPIGPGEQPIRRGIVFRCLTRYVPGLVLAGFDILSTANNHAFDQGKQSIDFTVDYLRANNILTVGTRKENNGDSFRQLIRRKGTILGFLAYSYAAYNDGGTKLDPQVATWHDLEEIRRQVTRLKQQADVVFVSLHAGNEYQRKPTDSQVNFAHAVIEAGADAVIGHHPHWIQWVEVYRNRPIFYSLGNFVFDQGDSQETTEGLMVEFAIEDRSLKSARLQPVIIEDYCCPRLAGCVRKAQILQKIGLDSDQLSFDPPSCENWGIKNP
jgi:poly-gamma-glutamate synthesis protein (capsule biosynthesis protein)